MYTALGLTILTTFVLGITLTLCVASVKYRDIPQFVANLVQVSFFITPVMWNAELMIQRGREVVLQYNPFYYLLEVVRAPLLNHPVEISVYLIATAISLTALVTGVYSYSRMRHVVMLYR